MVNQVWKSFCILQSPFSLCNQIKKN